MTNLQQGAPILSAKGLRRLWFGTPALGLGAVSLLLAAAVLVPLWQALQRDTTRLRQLEDLQMQVSLMRQQLRAQDIQQEKALQQRDKLLRMISGSGDISTLLAVLDREAKAAGVQLDLYEPQAGGATTPAPETPPPAAGNQAKPPPANPLETAGLQSQGMLISLRGPYPNLLTFLQRLESLNLLVIQSDLKLEAPPASTDPKKASSRNVSMKLSLRVYGKPGNGEAATSPATPAGSPPATPPAAPGAPGTAPGAAPGAANPAPASPAATQGSPTAPAASPPAAAPAQPGQAGGNTSAPAGANAPAAPSPPAASRPAGR